MAVRTAPEARRDVACCRATPALAAEEGDGPRGDGDLDADLALAGACVFMGLGPAICHRYGACEL
jgi:hypothetical protein